MDSPLLRFGATDADGSVNNTPPQGALDSAGAGITGGYTGNSLSLKITIAFLLGLALYNACELLLLIAVTFTRYRGLYFWSLAVSSLGVIPYATGFLVKFFQLLDPATDAGYVAVVLLTIGWWTMVTGQSVVLWSRLHLVTSSRRVLRWTLAIIIINGTTLHSVTTVLTFGSNSNTLNPGTLRNFVQAYSIIEKVQMVGFFLQEVTLSIIYIRETLRLLRLSQAAQDDSHSLADSTTATLRSNGVRKTMYQLLALNAAIIAMDITLLAVAFANLYLIETSLKGAVYSVKLKLEFAVLGRLVTLVRIRSASTTDPTLDSASLPPLPPRATSHATTTAPTTRTNNTSTALSLEKQGSISPGAPHTPQLLYPNFVDPSRLSSDVTHACAASAPAPAGHGSEGSFGVSWDFGGDDAAAVHEDCGRRGGRAARRGKRGSWIDEEMDRWNIG